MGMIEWHLTCYLTSWEESNGMTQVKTLCKLQRLLKRFSHTEANTLSLDSLCGSAWTALSELASSSQSPLCLTPVSPLFWTVHQTSQYMAFAALNRATSICKLETANHFSIKQLKESSPKRDLVMPAPLLSPILIVFCSHRNSPGPWALPQPLPDFNSSSHAVLCSLLSRYKVFP